VSVLGLVFNGSVNPSVSINSQPSNDIYDFFGLR